MVRTCILLLVPVLLELKSPVSYNIYFDSNDVAMVRSIARDVRAVSGGLKGVKAFGLLAQGGRNWRSTSPILRPTPISQVHRRVTLLAARHKAEITETEVVGLIPEAACERESEWMRQLSGFDPQTKILERRLETPLPWPGME